MLRLVGTDLLPVAQPLPAAWSTALPRRARLAHGGTRSARRSAKGGREADRVSDGVAGAKARGELGREDERAAGRVLVSCAGQCTVDRVSSRSVGAGRIGGKRGGRAGEVCGPPHELWSGRARHAPPLPLPIPVQVALAHLVVVSQRWDVLAHACGLHQLLVGEFTQTGGNLPPADAESRTAHSLPEFLRPFRWPSRSDSDRASLRHAETADGAATGGPLPAPPALAHTQEAAFGRIHGVLFTLSGSHAAVATNMPLATDSSTASAANARDEAPARSSIRHDATVPAGIAGASSETSGGGALLRPRCGVFGSGCIQMRNSADGSWGDMYLDTEIEELLVEDVGGRERLQRGRKMASSAELFTAEQFERFDGGAPCEHDGTAAGDGDAASGVCADDPGFVGLQLKCICRGSKREAYHVLLRLAQPSARLVHHAECSCAYFTAHHTGGVLRAGASDEAIHLCKHQVGLLERARWASLLPRYTPPATATAGHLGAGATGVSQASVGPTAAVEPPDAAGGGAAPAAAAPAPPNTSPKPRAKRKLPQFGTSAGPAPSKGCGSAGSVPVVGAVAGRVAADQVSHGSAQLIGRAGKGAERGGGRGQGRGAAGAGSLQGRAWDLPETVGGGPPVGSDEQNALYADDGGEMEMPQRPITCAVLVAIAEATLARARARAGCTLPSGRAPADDDTRAASAPEEHQTRDANGHWPTQAEGQRGLVLAPARDVASSVDPTPARVPGAADLGAVSGEVLRPPAAAASTEESSAPRSTPGLTASTDNPRVSLADLRPDLAPVGRGPTAAKSAPPAAASSMGAMALDSAIAPAYSTPMRKSSVLEAFLNL